MKFNLPLLFAASVSAIADTYCYSKYATFTETPNSSGNFSVTYTGPLLAKINDGYSLQVEVRTLKVPSKLLVKEEIKPEAGASSININLKPLTPPYNIFLSLISSDKTEVDSDSGCTGLVYDE